MEAIIEVNSIENPDIAEVGLPTTIYDWNSSTIDKSLLPLWTSFKAALTNGDPNSRQLFQDFARSFIQLYRDWCPRDESTPIHFPTELCPRLIDWLSIAAQANASLRELTNELLVLEILSRSPENRRYLRSTPFYQLLHMWLRTLLRTFPSDDGDDMLSFGMKPTTSNAHFIRTLKVILVVIDHWLCLPYPVDSDFPFLNLIGLCDHSQDEECKIDVSVELSVMLVKSQKMNKEEWSQVTQHLLRLVVGSMSSCSNLRRRVQLDRMLREIHLANITGSQLIKLPEDPSVSECLLSNGYGDVFLLILFQLKRDQISMFLIKLMQSLPSIHDDHRINLFLTVIMNYCSHLTAEEVCSFLLPFFSSLSSLSSPENELALRQHFFIVLYQLIKSHPTIVSHLNQFFTTDSLESFCKLHHSSVPDSSLLFLVVSLFTVTPIEITYQSTIPSSTLLLLSHSQTVQSSLIIHHTDMFVLFLTIVLRLPDTDCLFWLTQITELLKNEWNCKLLSNHPSVFSILLTKYQTAGNSSIEEALLNIIQMALSCSISPSALSSLLSCFTSQSTAKLSILSLLHSLYTLPSSSPEILLDEGSYILFTADGNSSIRLPNPDDWCFTLKVRCLSTTTTTLVEFKEEKNELQIVMKDNTLQLVANKLLISSVPFVPTELNNLSLIHRTSIPSSLVINDSAPVKLALPRFTQPSIRVSSSLLSISSIIMTTNKNNTPFITFLPSLVKNDQLINKEIPINTKRTSFLSMKNKQETAQEVIPEIKGCIEGCYQISRNIHISTSIQSLGGVSVLFPLLFSEVEDSAYFASVFTLLREVMVSAESSDRDLLTECLLRIDPSILGEHITKLIDSRIDLTSDILNTPSTIQYIEDFKVDDPIERCLQCLCCEEVSEGTQQYDGYNDWCVSDQEAMAIAWSRMITVDHAMKDQSSCELFIRLLREGIKRESGICDNLLPLLSHMVSHSSFLSYLSSVSLNEYTSSRFALFTPFLLSLESCSNPQWRQSLFQFLMELFLLCHKNAWKDLKINPSDCMVLLYRIKKCYSGMEISLPSNLFFTVCILNQANDDELMLSYPNWFMVLLPSQYDSMLRLVFKQYLSNPSYPLAQTLLSLLTFVQATQPDKGYSLYVNILRILQDAISHLIEMKRWQYFGQIVEFLYKELLFYVVDDVTGSSEAIIQHDWKVLSSYLKCVLLLPTVSTASLLSSYFVKLMQYMQFVTMESSTAEPEEEDLLFGLTQPKESVKQEEKKSLLNEELEKQIVSDICDLINSLVMVSDLNHLYLLSTQLNQYKCFTGDVMKYVMNKQDKLMTEELKRNRAKSHLINDYLNEVSIDEKVRRMRDYLTACGVGDVHWLRIDDNAMRTSLQEPINHVLELMECMIIIHCLSPLVNSQKPSPVNNEIMIETEALTHMMDGLFMEWFMKREQRLQLYNKMMKDMMAEESIWFTSDCIKIFSLCSNVTSNMIHPQIETQYLKQLSSHHAAASVWDVEKMTPTPTTPTPSSSILLSQQLPSALLSLACSVIKPLQNIKGTLYLSKDTLTFIVDPEQKKEREKKIEQIDAKIQSGKKGENKWKMLDPLENEIWTVRYLQSEEFRLFQFRDTAVELFFTNGDSVFISFDTMEERNRFHSILRSLKLPSLEPFLGASAEERWKRDDCFEKWLRGDYSNFEYLMRINRLAGRSLNDLSQYYVMPWILKDYDSPVLDLNNESVYRDLSKPIGAQLDSRREVMKEKYDMMSSMYESSERDPLDPLQLLSPPPRFFSTFYSNSSYVIWYLLRIEPFTSYHIFLQDGRFDRPDRQFHSIKSAYMGSTTNDGDCKELIPEFFYCSSMFVNSNKLNLGSLQDSDLQMNHVELPPWAKNSTDFVIKMREALESPYVTKHINEWVDLVFGYKQRGKEAIAAMNVFNHTSYLTKEEGENLFKNYPEFYSQAASIAENFGIVPQQISQSSLKKIKKVAIQMNCPVAVNQNWIQTPCILVGYDMNGIMKVLGAFDFRQYGIIAAEVVNSTTIIGISNKGVVVQFSIKPPSGKQTTFTITPTVQNALGNWNTLVSSSVSSTGSTILLTDFGGIRKYGKNGEFVNCVESSRLFTGSVISQDASWIACICDDGSVSVYNKELAVKMYEFRIKNDFISHVSFNTELMICGVVGRNGALTLFSLFTGKTILSIRLPIPFKWCCITAYSTILVYSASIYTLSLYSFTGDLVDSREIMVEPIEMKTVDNKYLLITSSRDPLLIDLRNLCDCSFVY